MNDYINLTKIIEDLNFEIKTLFNYEKNIRNKGFINIFFGNKCGKGVLLFQNPNFAENYASIIKINNEQIKILIMCRVNPKKIRQPEIFKNCWVLNPTNDEIRPYRILIKKISNFSYMNKEQYIKVEKFPVDYILSAIKSNDFSIKTLSKKDIYKADNPKRKEYFALHLYINYDEYYFDINKFLTKKDIKSEHFTESQLKSLICCLHNEIKRIQNIEDNTIVYLGLNRKFPPDIGIGSKFYFREFILATKDEKTAKVFGPKTLMKITIKNNGINNIQNYCCSPDEITRFLYEKEVILNCHCSFIVTDFINQDNIDYVSLICEGFLFD